MSDHKKVRTIHYAGQQIKTSEPARPAVMAPKPRSWFQKLIRAMIGCSCAMMICASAMAQSRTTGEADYAVSVTNVFVSSSVSISASGGVTLSSRTVTINKRFFLQHVDVSAFTSTASSATALTFGTASLQSPLGTIIATMTFQQTVAATPRWVLDFAQPIPFASQSTVYVVINSVTSTAATWISNMIGNEK